MIKAGHQAYAPTLAGNGRGVVKEGLTHASTVQSVVDYVLERDLSDLVVVGHSYGGSIIQKVAEHIADRISRLVFQNAFVLLDGQSMLDENPPHYVPLIEKLVSESTDDSFILPFEICRDAFFNSVDGDTAAKLWEQCFSSQPMQPFRDKLDLKKFYSLAIPRSYLNCTEDIALPPGPEHGWHPRMSNRLGLYRLVQMPGDHETIVTNPELMAVKLVEAGRD